MCDKAIDSFLSTTEYLPDRLKTQEMCGKAIDKCRFGFAFVPSQYKTQECMIKSFLKILLT